MQLKISIDDIRNTFDAFMEIYADDPEYHGVKSSDDLTDEELQDMLDDYNWRLTQGDPNPLILLDFVVEDFIQNSKY